MGTNYLNHPWSEITRDERCFCAELFQIIKNNKYPFNKLLVEKGIIDSVDTDYDIGYEVCFYRDYIYKYGYKNNHNIKTIMDRYGKFIFPPKRTFDICLFFENEIVIIEAKAQQGFETKQLLSFGKDQELLKLLLGNDIGIKTIGLCSSYYSPGEETTNHFDVIITWEDIQKKYANKYKILQRANDSYNK